MALIKIDIQIISDRLGTSKRDLTRIVESVFEIMKEQLSEANMVKISRFGNFLVKSKKARRGRNPQTGV
jgi:integration host factor subunit alpha